MTNGERLYKSNMYDILCRIQNARNIPESFFCVIDAISGKEHKCSLFSIGIDFGLELDCEKCIEHWLNKEGADWK